MPVTLAPSLLPFKSACSAVASSTCSLLKVHAVAQTDTAHLIGLEESHQSSTFNGDRAAHAEVQRIQLLEESHQLAPIYLRIFVFVRVDYISVQGKVGG